MKKKWMTFVVAACMLFVTIVPTGCNSETGVEIDETKTQLHVGIYDGGLGTQWANELIPGFEAMYSDYVGKDGKVGVQVIIDPQKENFETASLKSLLSSGASTNDIYYTVNSPYQFVNTTYVADVTDIVNEKVYAADGNLAVGNEPAVLSIADKMSDRMKGRFTFNDKIMGVPYNSSIQGFVYDRDLFEEYGYIDETNPGPDGVMGTFDDGLPATFAQFQDLFARMVSDSIIPFTFTGYYSWYFSSIYATVQAQYDGFDQCDLAYTYDGYLTSSTDESINAANDGLGTKITPENGYLVADRKGARQALEFMRFLFSNSSYYSSRAAGQSQTHTQAQSEFINSIEATGANKRIAMILEGTWWENEARGAFAEMETTFRNSDYGYGKRDFRFLPLPIFDGQASEASVFVNQEDGPIVFINSASSNKELAGKWMQYVIANDSLAVFNEFSGSSMPYSYTLNDEQLARLTPFARSAYEINTQYADRVYTRPVYSDYAKYATLAVAIDSMEADATGELSTNYSSPYEAFRTNQGLTADAYFGGYIAHYNATDWATSYNDFMTIYG